MRRLRRSVALSLALIGCFVRLGLLRLRGPLTSPQRALWLQGACRGVLHSLGVRLRVQGSAPSAGLVVSNHLSYLDIAVYSAAFPCVFVSKQEVSDWPYFGAAARAAGTVFLDRASRTSAAAARIEIASRMQSRVPVLLFPEGTSTDGSRVGRFHSTLFEPAVAMAAPITSAAIRYLVHGPGEERDLCWFGDAGFLSHLWRVIGGVDFTAELSFGEPHAYADRRQAAEATHAEVVAMRTGTPLVGKEEYPGSSMVFAQEHPPASVA